jgi:hypothetical protein
MARLEPLALGWRGDGSTTPPAVHNQSYERKIVYGIGPCLEPEGGQAVDITKSFRRKLCSSQSKASSDHHQGHNEMYSVVNNYQVILKGETWCLFLC